MCFITYKYILQKSICVLYLYQQKQIKLKIMKLSKAQNQELDSLKMHIETIEKRIESANSHIEIATDCKDYKKITELQKAIEWGQSEIKKMVTTQSKSMKLEYDLVLDLIFDREYTLELIKGIMILNERK